MLPYTTYNIPENPVIKPQNSGKWLWIITDHKLTEQDKELLEKISSALNADFNQDVNCVQTETEQSVLLGEMQGSKPRLIISFGVAPEALGLWIDLPKSGLMTLENFTFILSSSLTDLAGSTSAKQDLWKCMKVFMESE